MTDKASVNELRKHFDGDVERFSDEQKGQETIVDAPLVLGMVEESIRCMNPDAQDLCDIGCGGGNYSIRIARKLPKLAITLVDLSEEMLQRARYRLEAEGVVVRKTIQDDIRNIVFKPGSFDIVVASASLHHLRSHEDWLLVFRNVFESLRPGGSFWICDIVKHENPEIEAIQRRRYAEFLIGLRDKAFQEMIFEMIERCDTPETISFQMQTLHDVGFRDIDVVHKNMLFFAMAARKF